MTGDLVFTAQLPYKGQSGQTRWYNDIPPEPQDAPVCAKQAANLGIKLPFFFTDGADDISLAEVGNAVEGAYVSLSLQAISPLLNLAKSL